jgi:hypothetical protein
VTIFCGSVGVLVQVQRVDRLTCALTCTFAIQ